MWMRIFFVFVLGFLGVSRAWAFDLTIVTQVPPTVPFQLVSATPFDRQSVSAPSQYSLRFSQPVKPDKSSIKIMDSFGGRVNDDELQSDGFTLVSALPVLTAGRYTVKWQTRCQCEADMVLSDTYHFTVK